MRPLWKAIQKKTCLLLFACCVSIGLAHCSLVLSHTINDCVCVLPEIGRVRLYTADDCCKCCSSTYHARKHAFPYYINHYKPYRYPGIRYNDNNKNNNINNTSAFNNIIHLYEYYTITRPLPCGNYVYYALRKKRQ